MTLTNAEKIQRWRDEHPDETITYRVLLDVLGLETLACVDLAGANLAYANLWGANLRFADLRYADLTGANLRYANLWGANLRFADLRFADLRYADLTGADLRSADLTGANLRFADLRSADLWGANLRFADLTGASLLGANIWGGLVIQAGWSGNGYMVPTPKGWQLTIGCWKYKTLADLDDLIHDRARWPDETGAERDRRRPILKNLYALCQAHMDLHPTLVDDLAAKWGVS